MDCDQALELISQRLDERLSLAQEQALARHLADWALPARAALLVDVTRCSPLRRRWPAPDGLSAVKQLCIAAALCERGGAPHGDQRAERGFFVVAVFVTLMRARGCHLAGQRPGAGAGPVGGQCSDLLESMARPLVTICGRVFGDSYHCGW